jgi:hypothetical protein
MPVADLRKNEMMAYLLDALEDREDIGHYGRLVFAMVARHFLSREELRAWLRKNPGFSEDEARALVHQVEEKDYSPPTRERILEWQAHQSFPICPRAEDPDAGNVYRDLQFPERVYDHITEYHEKKTELEES